jgi:hypothetical protein
MQLVARDVVTVSIKPSAFLYLLLICTSCQQSIAQKPQIPPPTVSPAPTLPKLERAQAIEIKNDWNGYSDITPILRHYRLKPNAQQLLTGNAHIAVGGYGASGVRQQVTKKVAIPPHVVQNFFVTLNRTPISVGIYKPIAIRKDDYPAVSIKITVDRQIVTFSSTSQGVGRKPWQVKIASNGSVKEYISNTDTPDLALKLLSPYLDREGIDRIIHRRRK